MAQFEPHNARVSNSSAEVTYLPSASLTMFEHCTMQPVMQWCMPPPRVAKFCDDLGAVERVGVLELHLVAVARREGAHHVGQRHGGRGAELEQLRAGLVLLADLGDVLLEGLHVLAAARLRAVVVDDDGLQALGAHRRAEAAARRMPRRMALAFVGERDAGAGEAELAGRAAEDEGGASGELFGRASRTPHRCAGTLSSGHSRMLVRRSC